MLFEGGADEFNTKGYKAKVLSAHIPLGLAEKVDAVAARLDRPRGWVVKRALAAWVDQEEKRHRLTLEALIEVDAGDVIDHATERAWADKLVTDDPLPPSER